MPKEDHCTNCGKPEPATGWFVTFGIGLKPEWFCTRKCFEYVADNEGEPGFIPMAYIFDNTPPH